MPRAGWRWQFFECGEARMDAHETNEIAEHIAGHHAHAPEGFRRMAALVVGVIGMLLAIASLGGENAMKETINDNILAADAYAFYQARNIRQDVYAATAELLAGMGKDASAYRARAQREADEKAKLLGEARDHDAKRAIAQRRDGYFDYARVLFQIAVVIGSVSIVATSRALLGFAGLLALVATLLSANGFLLLF
jgi:uncharacterized membrane-anchored protein YhcB (DUF1043 family)